MEAGDQPASGCPHRREGERRVCAGGIWRITGGGRVDGVSLGRILVTGLEGWCGCAGWIAVNNM